MKAVSLRDPELMRENDDTPPVDVPHICERTGCGHEMGLHWAESQQKHLHCKVCNCPGALSPFTRSAGRARTPFGPGEAPERCYICGDPADHLGLPHGEVTGDGKTRADADNAAIHYKAIVEQVRQWTENTEHGTAAAEVARILKGARV